MSAAYGAVTRDGYLAAAGRQGTAEIGTALKAFPDAIQERETGTIFNPTQGEIASDRSIYGHAFEKESKGEATQMADKTPNFLKEILDRGKAGYERGKERSLADEQKNWEKAMEEKAGPSSEKIEKERPGGRER